MSTDLRSSSAFSPKSADAKFFASLTYRPQNPKLDTAVPNPLADFISDELYSLFRSNDLINEKGLRDFIIRRVFKSMKESHRMSTSDAIERLQGIYPYLQLDTIRKIVYRVYPSGQKKNMI